MASTPCKDCTTRQLGCHGTCELYNEWRKVQNEIKEQIKQEKDIKGALIRSHKKRITTRRTRKGKYIKYVGKGDKYD